MEVYLPLIVTNYPCRDAYEPNNSSKQAAPLAPGQRISGRICPPDDRDVFVLDVTGLSPIIAEITDMVPGTNFDMWLYDPDGTPVKGSTKPGNADEHIEHTPTQTGRYYLLVFRPDAAPLNARPYTLQVTFQGPVVCNGSFETGSFEPCWSHGRQLARSISTTVARSGTYSALLGDPSYECRAGVPVGSARLSQSFIVPAVGTPTLSFWYRVFSQDQLSGDSYDSFDVYLNGTLVLRAGNTTPTYGCDQPTTDTGWQLFVYDLSVYRSQTVGLRFENASQPDEWYNTWTYVDDVQVAP